MCTHSRGVRDLDVAGVVRCVDMYVIMSLCSYDFRMLTLIFHLFSAKIWYARCPCNNNRGMYLHTLFEYIAASYVHSIHTNMDTNVDTKLDTKLYSYETATEDPSEVP